MVRLGSDGDRWGLPFPGGSSLFAGGRQRRRRVDEVIELVGATAYAHRPIGQMSGGEQQRLLIAQALVRRPRMLLLDEPLDSLDLPNQASVAALISEISQRFGITVLIVAHDVNPIVSYLDGVVYVARGGAVCGSPDEVITSETLTTLYGTPIEVLRTSDGQMVVVGSPEAPAHHADRHTARPLMAPCAPTALAAAGLSWNLGADLHQMLALHFMVNAYRAGTIVAVIAGAVGWFMVLRRQSFAGHTLAVVSFPGAAGAIWLGVSATAGYFAGSIVAALVIAMVPRSTSGRARSEESAVIGTVQAFALACGVLFVSLYGGFLDSLTGLLFGTFLGISDGQVVDPGPGGRGRPGGAGRHRPARCSSPPSTPTWPRARGVPVRGLSVAFLLLLGCAAAEVSQITGALLVFALLVMPAAAAQQITARPALSLALTVVLAVAVTWVSLLVAFYSVYPVGFYVSTIGFGVYVLAAGSGPGHRLGSRAPGPARRARRDVTARPRPRRWADDAALALAATVNPFVGLAHMLDHPFLRSAFVAGTCIALAAGLVGYVVVLRGQVFSADALSHVAFTGALAALAFGIDLRAGLYGACVVFAVLLAALGRRAAADDTVIGSVFAWVLGLGALFLSVFTTSQSGTGTVGSDAGVNVLFGSILGLSSVPGPGRLAGGPRRGGGLRGHRPPAGLRQSRRGRGRGPGGAGPGPGLRLLRPVGRHRRRGHPGGGCPAAAGAGGGPGRGQPAAHVAALRGRVAVGRHRRGVGVDRADRGLPGPQGAPELRDPGRGHRHLPGGHRRHLGPGSGGGLGAGPEATGPPGGRVRRRSDAVLSGR